MRFRDQIREALSRAVMPQVPQKNLPEIYARLTEMGVQCDVGVVECSKLKPIQDGINREKVERMKQAIADGEALGHIVVTREGYIVDGHHRWVAMQEACGDDKKINAVKINLPKKKALGVVDAMTEHLNEGGAVPVHIYVTYERTEQSPGVILGEIYEDKNEAERVAKKHGLKVQRVDFMLSR